MARRHDTPCAARQAVTKWPRLLRFSSIVGSQPLQLLEDGLRLEALVAAAEREKCEANWAGRAMQISERMIVRVGRGCRPQPRLPHLSIERKADSPVRKDLAPRRSEWDVQPWRGRRK